MTRNRAPPQVYTFVQTVIKDTVHDLDHIPYLIILCKLPAFQDRRGCAIYDLQCDLPQP
jgi:hypothetical protein